MMSDKRLTDSIKERVSRVQKTNPKRLKSDDEGDQVVTTGTMSGWEWLENRMTAIKIVLVFAAILIATIFIGYYIGWYAVFSFYAALMIYYVVMRYTVKIPQVVLIEYDPENKIGDILGVPRNKFRELKKEGAKAHVTFGGREAFICQEFDQDTDTIDFGWIHGKTFLDFWIDDSAYADICSRLQQVYDLDKQNLAIPELVGQEVGMEYTKDIFRMKKDDQRDIRGSLSGDFDKISNKRPSERIKGMNKRKEGSKDGN